MSHKDREYQSKLLEAAAPQEIEFLSYIVTLDELLAYPADMNLLILIDDFR